MTDLFQRIETYDERRDILAVKDSQEAIQFAVEHFFTIGKKAIEEKGVFSVALSGGSTPKAIYQEIAKHENRLDWTKVLLFWSDERSVPPTDPNSNYKMAMDAGFSSLPIPSDHIFRMIAEDDIEENAKKYETILLSKVPNGSFDLVLLGMGEDGHTASLFPKTHGLHSPARQVIANYIPQLDTWRMTLTFECINASANIAIYVLGKSKARMVKEIFDRPLDPDLLPIQKIGTPSHKALWILDDAAASSLVR